MPQYDLAEFSRYCVTMLASMWGDSQRHKSPHSGSIQRRMARCSTTRNLDLPSAGQGWRRPTGGWQASSAVSPVHLLTAANCGTFVGIGGTQVRRTRPIRTSPSAAPSGLNRAGVAGVTATAACRQVCVFTSIQLTRADIAVGGAFAPCLAFLRRQFPASIPLPNAWRQIKAGAVMDSCRVDRLAWLRVKFVQSPGGSNAFGWPRACAMSFGSAGSCPCLRSRAASGASRLVASDLSLWPRCYRKISIQMPASGLTPISPGIELGMAQRIGRVRRHLRRTPAFGRVLACAPTLERHE